MMNDESEGRVREGYGPAGNHECRQNNRFLASFEQGTSLMRVRYIIAAPTHSVGYR
jgi:hypothetical protein